MIWVKQADWKHKRKDLELAMEILIPDLVLGQLLKESNGKIYLEKWARRMKLSQTMLAWRLGIPGYF
jgi:hypothetical protein